MQLHVIHDLGGGAAKWVRDFASGDSRRENLVLRSFTLDQNAAGGVALYRNPIDREPLRIWKFTQAIPAVAVRHEEYRAVFKEILHEYRIRSVVISSLIGHSLEALDTNLPTVVVFHDYFPYCPAINLYFNGVCAECGDERIGRCHEENRRFDPFVGFPTEARVGVRERYMELVLLPHVKLVVPGRSVADHLVRLDKRFSRASITVIPHGYANPLNAPVRPMPANDERMRVLVLGQLSAAKGVDLLRDAMPAIREFADVYLLGSGELGELFTFQQHVHVLSHYEIEELPGHVAAINPHVGVLASVVAETFSYALSELMMLGVPVIATSVGSFAERIEPGRNGFLFEPNTAALVETLRRLDADRSKLAGVTANLALWKARSAVEMVADYERLLPIDHEVAVKATKLHRGIGSLEQPRDSAVLADMWKEVKRLHIHVWSVGQARERAERSSAEARAAAARLEAELHKASQSLALRELALHDTGRQLEQLGGLLQMRDAQIAAIYASTSWKISAPVRWSGRKLRQLRLLARVLRAAARNPSSWARHGREVANGWRTQRLLGVKKALLALQPDESLMGAWSEYRRIYQSEVRPKIVAAIREMDDRPLISVLVPTYNTPELMLREMLASVQDQLYPNWQLCIADDGSTLPHVRRMLEEATAADSRVKVHFSDTNRGVSHASNCALAMASGDFLVLLDHDDILEEQALFRVAEAWLSDRPDVLYSDEILTEADGHSPRQFVYRPAFSPEFLRGHPYIVHLVGFRPMLLREIGGFDESLHISQDYDLILRATEKARKVVHLPEILYRWRVHGGSAGHRRMGEVMETSGRILQAHLVRCGSQGRVEEGTGFNFFDARYVLGQSIEVVIVIPTKNHRALLRQCIESIRKTTQVAHRIVVIDHESDDPETLEYLASLRETTTVLRYSGPFNFSAINNWAVDRIEGSYTHLLFCNNDIEALRAGWLERMLEIAQQASVGVVGAKLYYPDRRTIQHAGVCVGAFRAAEHYGKFLQLSDDRPDQGYFGALVVNHEVAAVTAACMLIRRDVFEAVDGFDEAIAVGFGDVDLCLRIGGLGYRVVFCPHAELVHHESLTRGISSHDPHPADTALYLARWRALIAAGDPYYNPGLSLSSTTWAVKKPLNCTFKLRPRVATRDDVTGFLRIEFEPSLS